jgi:hypothetical protein
MSPAAASSVGLSWPRAARYGLGMKKIPTLFQRDWDGDRSRVIDEPHPDCAWVFAGEGVATRKLDGTSCLIRDGRMFRRRELKPDQAAPVGFEVADRDEETGKTVGWVPVGDGPEDKWHREAFDRSERPGTYELIGPQVQGNPERAERHILVPHAITVNYPFDAPRTFDGLMAWLAGRDIEGIVFHHPDGRMAKIKQRDFGLKRPGITATKWSR